MFMDMNQHPCQFFDQDIVNHETKINEGACSLHFEDHSTKMEDDISLIFIHLFFSKQFFKFNQLMIGILDNFRQNLFPFLPLDYHLILYRS